MTARRTADVLGHVAQRVAGGLRGSAYSLARYGYDRGFRALPEAVRTRFLQRNLTHMPPNFWILNEEQWVPRARLDYPGAPIHLRVTSKREHMRLRSCAKEPWTVAWIEEWVKPGDVLYDVGANVGAYALVAAKWSRGRARVVALEPGYASFAALCDNIVFNDAADSITPLPIALAAETGLACFNYSELRSGAALHSLEGAPLPGCAAPVYRQSVLAYRLDDLVEQFRLPRPNHVKLDVDGAELAVLQGAMETLGAPGLRSLLIEVDDRQADELTRLLETRGLSLRTRFDKRDKQGEITSYWYGLFVPASWSS